MKKILSYMKNQKEDRWLSDRVLEIYSTLLLEVWEIVSALIGEAVLTILLNLAIKKLEDKYGFLEKIKVSEEGISFEKLKEDCRNISAIQVHRGFQSLINNLINLFSILAEGVINKEIFPKIFPKVKEAERIVSQK